MLYLEVARALRRRIVDGAYPPGSRLPGLRGVSQEFSVSISTATAAIQLLEDEGLVEGRRRSGFYVRQHSNGAQVNSECSRPVQVTNHSMTLNLLRSSNSTKFGRLGVAIPVTFPQEGSLPESNVSL